MSAVSPNRITQTDDLGLLLRSALEGAQSSIWTAMPGIIQSFDPVKLTGEVQLAIQGRQTNPDQTYKWVNISKLVDCPVVFPSGGGFTLTFPIVAGDECLVVFSSRCIDAWYASGGYANRQLELRMHDLSDGFIIPGPRSLANALPNVSASEVQLRDFAGTTRLGIAPGGIVNIVAAGAVNIQAPVAAIVAPIISMQGDVTITGMLNVVGPIVGADFRPSSEPYSYLHHKHNVISGSNLGPPVSYP